MQCDHMISQYTATISIWTEELCCDEA